MCEPGQKYTYLIRCYGSSPATGNPSLLDHAALRGQRPRPQQDNIDSPLAAPVLRKRGGPCTFLAFNHSIAKKQAQIDTILRSNGHLHKGAHFVCIADPADPSAQRALGYCCYPADDDCIALQILIANELIICVMHCEVARADCNTKQIANQLPPSSPTKCKNSYHCSCTTASSETAVYA